MLKILNEFSFIYGSWFMWTAFAIFLACYIFYVKSKSQTNHKEGSFRYLFKSFAIFAILYLVYLVIKTNYITRIYFSQEAEIFSQATIGFLIFAWVAILIFKITSSLLGDRSKISPRLALGLNLMIAFFLSPFSVTGGIGAAIGSTFEWSPFLENLYDNAWWRLHDFFFMILIAIGLSVVLQGIFGVVPLIATGLGYGKTLTNEKKRKPWDLPLTVVAVLMGLILAYLPFVPIAPGFPSVKSKERMTKGNQAMIQSALEMYRSDHKGSCPKDMRQLLGKYLKEIPFEQITQSNNIVSAFDGSGGWSLNPKECSVTLNIQGKDSSGIEYRKWQ